MRSKNQSSNAQQPFGYQVVCSDGFASPLSLILGVRSEGWGRVEV